MSASEKILKHQYTFFGAKNSNTANCNASVIPPARINNYGRSLNDTLGLIEGQTGSYYTTSKMGQKIIDRAANSAHQSGNGSALSSTVYITAQKYGLDTKAYSFALGAGEQLSKDGPNLLTVIETLLGTVNSAEYDRGSRYTREVYLKDTARRNVKDSCNREPEDKMQEGTCKVEERTMVFQGGNDGIPPRRTFYELNAFDYGEHVDLTFVNYAPITGNFNHTVGIYGVALGGKKYGNRRPFDWSGFNLRPKKIYLNGYSTSESGNMYLNYYHNYPKNIPAQFVYIYCTPAYYQPE